MNDRAAWRLEGEMLAKTRASGAGSARPELHVIFDAETLLLDPLRGMRESLQVALRESVFPHLAAALDDEPHASPADLRVVLSRLLEQRDSARVEAVLRCYSRHYAEHGRYRCRFRPGSLQLLATLAAMPHLALHYMTHIGAVAAARVLDVYGLQHVPRSIYTGEQPCCPGIRPTLIRDWLEPIGRRLGNWVLLSDYPPELAAARRLGMRSVGLGYGRLPPAVIRRLRPDVVATDVAAVTSALRVMDNASSGFAASAIAARLH